MTGKALSLIYHQRPQSLVGTTLLPLTQLRDLDIDAYNRATPKYRDRPGMTERWVEPLECAWSECIFLSPIEPGRLLVDTYTRARFSGSQWLAIEAAALDANRAIIMFPSLWSPGSSGPPPIRSKQCVAFNEENLARAAAPTERTLARLRDPRGSGPLWVDVAHVLYRGTIDVSHTETIII